MGDGPDPALALRRELPPEITYTVFNSESELKTIRALIEMSLSEPYSIYTYRYFVYNWPELCIFARHGERYVGVIVSKMEQKSSYARHGYIAMLAVEPGYRLLRIGTKLVEKTIEAMLLEHVDEIALETELSNKAALRLYESLGFIREKRMLRFYMNGVDALGLRLILSSNAKLQ
ncbi:N-alpha-acetyltransferase 30A [Drosophila grimshawi]|uniref:GH15207 n=1 Tax=Drosophila grimshawi TaxID=7222 RepID=B4IXI8_DROGR|nr:N-alpha-acetyltransferase 30A [Drosophila grimshawi]EDV96425.1 GH15207 [Drosophila grimshawi]EDW04628.1 GH19626 [Drosophila grimshawi]